MEAVCRVHPQKYRLFDSLGDHVRVRHLVEETRRQGQEVEMTVTLVVGALAGAARFPVRFSTELQPPAPRAGLPSPSGQGLNSLGRTSQTQARVNREELVFLL